MSRLNRLMNILFSQNRIDDAKRCTEDPAYRDLLFKEFKLA